MTANDLALYYAGVGVPLFLVWACLADMVIDTPSQSIRTRYRRAATALAVLGVLHPGFALSGLDVARQLARPDFEHEPGALAAVRRASWGVGASAVSTVAAILAFAQ